MALRKAWIYLCSFHLWANSRDDLGIYPWLSKPIEGKGKLWNQTSCTLLKMTLCHTLLVVEKWWRKFRVNILRERVNEPFPEISPNAVYLISMFRHWNATMFDRKVIRRVGSCAFSPSLLIFYCLGMIKINLWHSSSTLTRDILCKIKYTRSLSFGVNVCKCVFSVFCPYVYLYSC